MERAVYRIIDANFNRAREAIRLVEEFCRFYLNSESLTGRAKQLRHELSGCLAQLDAGKLIAGRDTPGDVGVGQKVANQLVRGDLSDCFTAGAKRLTEALRVLAEMTQTINPSVSQDIEELRYRAYTLEKDIRIFSSMAEKFKKVRLYILISSNLPGEVIPLVQHCAAGGADCIQLRSKGMNDDELFALSEQFVQICKDFGVVSIINDRVDIAVGVEADGVHLGQNDLAVAQARKLQLRPMIIGKSTHSVEQLRKACTEQPCYVSLGPVFSTGTKPDAKPVGLAYVRQAAEILAGTGIASVAIGAITPDNVEEVLQAGASAVAVCSAVTGAKEPAAVCRLLKEKIAGFLGQ
jgi:thiamine-phosphate pyrophosphorylase